MKVSRVIVIILLGLLIGSGAVYIKLRMERGVYEKEIADLNSRSDLLRKKYSEEKARADGLLRTKSTLEGKIRAVRAEMADLKEQKELAVQEQNTLRAGLEKKTAVCEEKVDTLSDRYDELYEKHKALVVQFDKKKKACEERTDTLLSHKDELDIMLKETTYNLERCEKHNKELAGIVNELVVKYRDKGVVDSIAQKEPFTGLKQVEMEKLIQEYQDKIDDHQLEQ